MKEKEIAANGGRYGESVGKVLVRCDESVEAVVVPRTEREIIIEHGDCAWMALYALPAPPPPIATAVVVSVAIRGCALPPSVLSFAALKQRVGCL